MNILISLINLVNLKDKRVWYNALTAVVVIATTFFGYEPNQELSKNMVNWLESPATILVGNFLISMLKNKGYLKS